MLTSNELRKKYLDFFKSKGHQIIPSASLIPENDPTALFTMAGMHPLVPYLLSEPHPAGKRLVDVQKCIRTGDIDEVGDKSHLTFFEMMGNWSLGDYFKEDAIKWSWEFLTSAEWLNLDPKKLAVSVFEGDENAPRDDDSANLWLSLGVEAHKIAYLPKEKNWWGPAGQTGPCGPDTEMFYWSGSTEYPSETSNPKTDEDNWLEIWNDVFMQYDKKDEKTFVPLKQQNVDTGMGLDRTISVLNGYSDIYLIDTLWPLIQKVEEICGQEYIADKHVQNSMRIIVDHLRAAVMIMGDNKGVAPSNVDQGYIVRRLIRRAIRHGRLLGINNNFCHEVAEKVIEIFAAVYPEVLKNKDFVLTELMNEESKFRNTIEKGSKNLETRILNLQGSKLSGVEAFDLYQSYGFPIEMTVEAAKEKGVDVDVDAFNEEMKKHQDLSRVGAEQKFKGGLADTSEISTKYHTATHLLHAALRTVLGNHVEQRGSNITSERMRFDFSHSEKLTDEQKQQVEDLVNKAISSFLPVTCKEMSVEEAKAEGAIGLFESKYGNKINVYTMGEDQPFSKEICGGPHVDNTGTLGHFKIIKEEACSSGVRRIKAILE